MKVVVFGSDGMLGRYISKYLSLQNINVIKLNRLDYDVSKATVDSLMAFLFDFQDLNPRDESVVIFNSAGVIKHRESDTSKQLEQYNVNTVFPRILSTIKRKTGVQVIQPSTDCVFSGLHGEYDETNKPVPTDHYSMSKLLADFNDNLTIIRTSIIGEEIYNKLSLLEWIRSHKLGTNINGYTNHFWNGITTLQYAKLVHHMIVNNIFWTGVKHVHSPTPVSKYELCNMINKTYDLGLNIEKFETEKSIDRTLNTVYEPLIYIPELDKQLTELREFKLL